ncbi:MAG: hypothetical protein HY904_25860 [Deltaproteobacteria bacterium]|nr:hypothetical protein [Deltaproteobacteria bacterium]
MNQPRQYRRSILLIDPQFQLKYTGLVVAMGAIISIICAYFIYRAYNENTQLLELSEAVGQEISRRESTTIVTVVVAFVVLEIVALGFWGVLVTHRIAGPIYIISRYLRELKDGGYPSMRPLRDGDEMKGFFDLFAATLEGMKQQDREAIAAIDEAMPKLGESGAALKAIRDRKAKALGTG